MKRLLSIAVIALMGAGAAMAQSTIVSSRSVSITREKAPSNTQWIFRAGVNVMGVAGDGSEGTTSKAGYDFAVSFEKPISNFGLNWGMELGLTSRGFGLDTKGEGSAGLMAHGIRFSPITFGYGYNITDDFKIAAHFGGFISVDYTANFKVSYQGESESVGIGDMEDVLGWEY
ncbi:MAG: PorT family protein, partial [Muribaculaceae bacterium]|nr:PorT family protein [Muribaculaceae bacterium]